MPKRTTSISLVKLDPAVKEKLLSLTDYGARTRYINDAVLAYLQKEEKEKRSSLVDREEVRRIVREVLEERGYRQVQMEEESASKEVISGLLDDIMSSMDQALGRNEDE